MILGIIATIGVACFTAGVIMTEEKIKGGGLLFGIGWVFLAATIIGSAP